VTLSLKTTVKNAESRTGRIVIVEDSVTLMVAALVEVDVLSAIVTVPVLVKLGIR
jgi:hypothetical protein